MLTSFRRVHGSCLKEKNIFNFQLSLYARRQPDEKMDEDDMDDEELVRLVDQTNEDDVSVTEDPIVFNERKLMREPPDESQDTTDEGTYNAGHG